MSTSATTAVPPKQPAPTSSSPALNPAPAASASAPASKPASPAIQEPKLLNYAQAVGKTSASGTSTPVTQAAPQPPSNTSTPSTIPPPQTTTPTNVANLNIAPSYPNGTIPTGPAAQAKPVMPPTGPAAMNGSRNHSRASSSASGYRATPPTGPHSAKPSLSGPGPYVPAYPSQSPRIPANGRNSPFPDYHDDVSCDPNYDADCSQSRSPPQSRSGSIAMARHGSQNSQSGGGPVPPSPRPANNRPPNVPQQYQAYPYANQQQFNPAYNHQQSPMQSQRGGFRGQAATFQPGMPGQYRPNQGPTRSPHAQPIQMAPQMQQMQPLQQMYQVPMPAPGVYVSEPQYLYVANYEYLPSQTDQYGNTQMQQQYVYQQQYHPGAQQHIQGQGQAYPGNTGPPPPPQMFSPPPQAPSYTPSPAPPRPMNQPMSRSTSVASDMNHQPPSQPPQHTAHPPATPSPAPKEDSPAPTFVIPKKSSAIKIVNPNTNAEITFTRAAKVAATAPDRTPSPAKTPVKQVVKSVSHSPAPSIEERPPSAQKTKGEIAEEMKAKVKASMEEARKKKEAEAEEARKKKEAEEEESRRKQAEKEEAERVERERIEKEKEEEERIAREKKEEEERLEKERLEEERLEQERIQREKEEEERKKAEEERIAKEKAEEEERLAKAEEEVADAARIAKEKEEEEAKTKDVEAAAAAATAAAAVAVTATAVSEETSASPERRSSLGAKKPTPPALSVTPVTPVSDGLQAAALKKASFITSAEFTLTKYPEGTNPPSAKAAQTFGQKGFHYDPDFLIQFRDVWKDKPSEDWDALIKDKMGDMESRSSRPVSGVSRGPPSGAFSGIGNFSIPKPVPPRTGMPPLGQFTPIQQSFPQRGGRIPSSGPGIQSPASPRAPSTKQRTGSRRQQAPQPPPPPPEPPVDPLLQNPNRWKPNLRAQEATLGPPPGGDGKLAPEVVQRKVKSLLNKLTLEKFDKITDQILEIASQSRHETDGRTLRQIIQLTFEKATDESNFSEMYALFCRKIMETIDPNITDPTVLNKDGQPLTGGQLFRKYLLNRCQEEFERGWKVNLPAKPDENELLSDEYYIAAKAKRQGLGLVQFIGELFKLNMLIEKIMYECIIRLLGGTDQPHPEPEEVESLCRLLVTVGKPLDEGKARSRMNAIYDALNHFRQTSDLESRIKFKILDILELRRHGWVGRATGQQGPKTIQEIHEDAAKAKLEAELARQTQQRNRPEFGRGDARQQEWGSLPRPKADTRAGDLSKLGMVRTSSSSGLGPQTSVFNSMRTMSSRGRTAAGNTLQREGSGQSSRTGTPGASTPPSVTSMNSFDIFRHEPESKEEEVSSPPARKISIPAPAPPPPAPIPAPVVDPDEGYSTTPDMKTIAGTASVSNFVITRKGFGSIHFTKDVDLTSIPSLTALREIVKIERGKAQLYPDESKKPGPGNGLNVPAKIVLEKIKQPPDFDLEEYIEDLKTRPDQEFVSYESETWTYQVEHF